MGVTSHMGRTAPMMCQSQDPRLAVPSVAIPYGQRFINLTLATAAQMVGYQLRGAGSGSNVTLAAPNVSQLSLYINNIFVNPRLNSAC